MNSSSFLDMVQSAVDKNKQFVDGYSEIMRKMNRENLRRTLETKQVSEEDLSHFKVKCEAMDELTNLFEKQTITTAAYGETSSPATGSEAEDGKKPVLRKGGYTETLEEVLKEVEKNRKERKSLIPDKPSSSHNKNELKIAGGNLSVLGMGGVGETVIHNNGSTNNYTFGTVQLTNRYYYQKKKTDGQ